MQQLLKKAQRGDEKALEELFFMHEASLYRIAFLYVKNEEDALDVMQEVAYRTFKNIKSLKNIEYFKTWITKITMNCAIDYIRQKGKVLSLEREWIENIEQISETQEKEIILRTTVEDLMNVLEVEEKSVIVLKYYEDVKKHQAAGDKAAAMNSYMLDFGPTMTTIQNNSASLDEIAVQSAEDLYSAATRVAMVLLVVALAVSGAAIGVTLFYALLSVVAIIAGDILMSLVDPRISFSTKDR